MVFVIFRNAAAGQCGPDIVARPRGVVRQAVLDVDRSAGFDGNIGQNGVAAIQRCGGSGAVGFGIGQPRIVTGTKLGGGHGEIDAAIGELIGGHVSGGRNGNRVGQRVVFLAGNNGEPRDSDRGKQEKEFFHNGKSVEKTVKQMSAGVFCPRC